MAQETEALVALAQTWYETKMAPSRDDLDELFRALAERDEEKLRKLVEQAQNEA